MQSDGKSDRARFDVVVEPGIKPEEITNLLFRIGGIYGCETCGLLGVDVHLTGQQLEQLEGMSSVRSVVAS
ncbi:MAG TPA: hypothetical protein VK765_00920 [Solirubrobacteraceae bacterium]|jgi:hypothetical protein|nr:hypothetical protein [Solirubrobacteraceae bacterium]